MLKKPNCPKRAIIKFTLKFFRRKISWLIAAVTLLCVISISFVGYLITTNEGAKIAINWLNNNTDYNISYSNINGNLINELEVSNLQIHNQDNYFATKHLIIKPILTKLLKSELVFSSISANGLQFKHNGQKSDKDELNLDLEQVPDEIFNKYLQPIKYKNFHLAWHANKILINDAKIEINNQTHIVNTLQFNLSSEHNQNNLPTINYNGDYGFFELNKIINSDNKSDKHQAKWDLKFFSKKIDANIVSNGKVLFDNKINKIQAYLETKNISAKISGNHARQIIDAKINNVQQQFILDIAGSIANKKVNINLEQPNSNDRINLSLTATGKFPYKLAGNLTAATDLAKSKFHKIFSMPIHQGKITHSAIISGSVIKPIYNWQTKVNNSYLNVARFGTKCHIDEIIIKNNPQNINQFIINGKADLGGGLLNINGYLEKDLKFNLHLSGKSLIISNTPEYFIVGNPDLIFAYDGTKPTLSGDIHVTEAEIKTLKEQGAQKPSSDVIIINKKLDKSDLAKVKKTQTKSSSENLANQVKLNLNITLGDKISYQGLGINTKVKGHLHLFHNDQDEGLPRAYGKLIFEKGKYKGFGKTFNIETGELTYVGQIITDPLLEVRAEQTIIANSEIINAGIRFAGNIKDLNVSFYSNPAMPENDVFSYLILGSPQAQASVDQGQILVQALSHFARFVRPPEDPNKPDLIQRLKLDKLAVNLQQNNKKPLGKNLSHFDDLDNVTLTLGKQISSRLYMDLTLGLLSSAHQLGFKYLINQHVFLEANLGESSSADVLFSFDN